METLKDKKIKLLEELRFRLNRFGEYLKANIDNGKDEGFEEVHDVMLARIKSLESDLASLNEQIDTAPTVRDELMKFYIWKCKNDKFADYVNDTHESIVDEYLSSTANQPKETV